MNGEIRQRVFEGTLEGVEMLLRVPLKQGTLMEVAIVEGRLSIARLTQVPVSTQWKTKPKRRKR